MCVYCHPTNHVYMQPTLTFFYGNFCILITKKHPYNLAIVNILLRCRYFTVVFQKQETKQKIHLPSLFFLACDSKLTYFCWGLTGLSSEISGKDQRNSLTALHSIITLTSTLGGFRAE